MKIKLATFFLFLIGNLHAQIGSLKTDVSFQSVGNISINCGGKLINGQINGINPNFVYEEDNKFFLEIAPKNSNKFIKIEAKKVALTTNSYAQFMLPDTLKIGQTYSLRMSSTSPKYVTNTTEMIFGIGLMPYSVDFQQEHFFISNEESYLEYSIKSKNKLLEYNLFESVELPLTYEIELSNGRKEIHKSYSNFSTGNIDIISKDSISIYKIINIVNSCGLKGEVNGEAKLIKKEFYDGISINYEKTPFYICEGSKLRIDFNSKSITEKTIFKVEFRENSSYNKIINSNVKLEGKNKIVVDIPSTYKKNYTYYYRIITENPAMISEEFSYTSFSKTSYIDIKPLMENQNEMAISFHQYSPSNIYFGGNSQSKIEQVFVNGKDISNEVVFDKWIFPKPKKDTVFQFSKISNSCGSLEIKNPLVTINPNDYAIFNFTTKPDTLCQGQTAEVGYEISNESKLDIISFDAVIYAYGYEFNPEKDNYSGAYSRVLFNDLEVTINKTKKTLSVSIPNDLDQQLKKTLGNKNININEFTLVVYISNAVSNIITTSSRISSIAIKLKPTLELITPKIETNGIGYVDLPVRFLGGSGIDFKLSNGQNGIISNDINENYTETNGAITKVGVFVEKTTNFKFNSAQNTCGIASVLGETTIVVNADKPSVVIDESKLLKKVCYNSQIELSLKKYGIWDKEPTYKITSIVYAKDNKPVIFEIKNIIGSTTTIKTPYGYLKMEVWAEDLESKIKSKSVFFNLFSYPQGFTINVFSDKVLSNQNNIETISVLNENILHDFQLSANGKDISFKIEGENTKGISNESNYSILYPRFNFKKDTIFTVNSMSNVCGTVEINRKIKLEKVESLLLVEDQTFRKFFLPNRSCGGTKRYITYQYKGKTPTKDSLVVQLAKFNNGSKSNFSNLVYFDVPTKRDSSVLSFIMPEDIYGTYAWRVKSILYNKTSNSDLFYEVNQKPKVKLSTASGKTEVLGILGADLFLNVNPESNHYFDVIMNDGLKYSAYDFQLIKDWIYDKNGIFEKFSVTNKGKFFTPTQTTTYSLKSAFNYCGYGTVEGSTTILVQPTIQNKISASSIFNSFCSGDSITLDLSYSGNFPKDTIMGVYLRNEYGISNNQELTTFKNTPKSTSFKLPTNLNPGRYYLNIRKKSRSQFSTPIYSKIDSLKYVNAKLNLDSEPIYIITGTRPNVNLSGTTEIFEGNTANLAVDFYQNEENESKSKDVNYFLGLQGIATYYKLSNGNTYNTQTTSILVQPPKTETFTISSIKNACGIGKATGSATVTVYPKTKKRIETIGFFREKYSYYNFYLYNCQGTKDSIDIDAFGIESGDVSKFKVALSDKDGNNYNLLKTTKSELIDDFDNKKRIRIWHELPQDLPYGNKYKIKGVLSDSDINSTPLNSFGTIRELPTASLSGNSTFLTGQKVEALVKLAGDAPWFLSLVDKENQTVFSNLPTKKDTLENFRNYNFNSVYDSEFKVELNPNKSTTYKIDKVYNYFCGFGKTNGELKVELILSNEEKPEPLVQVFPNPTTAEVNLNLSTLNEAVVVETYTILGNLINAQTYDINQLKEHQKIDFSRMSNGIYLIKIRSGKFFQTYRIVKL